GGLQAGAAGPGGEPGEPAAAEVVAVLGLLGAAQGLAVEQVGGVELAAVEEEVEGGVEVAGGDDLVGALELTGREAAGLRTWWGRSRRRRPKPAADAAVAFSR